MNEAGSGFADCPPPGGIKAQPSTKKARGDWWDRMTGRRGSGQGLVQGTGGGRREILDFKT